MRFGRLVAVHVDGKASDGHKIWLCVCDCGRTKKVLRSNLIHRTRSCGCLLREGARKGSFKHGLSHTNEHSIWRRMIQRCGDSNHRAFNRYGGRGIKVCERWLSFPNFYKDMGPRPSKQHSIDRKNNDQGYSPENCHWATWVEQATNTRANVRLTFNGTTQCLSQWERVLGLTRGRLHARLKSGWSIERALKTP